jgi:nicotinate-nucleotide adenylyltransferase
VQNHNLLLLSNIVGNRLYKSVGLLGGSFNPAHNGHKHISLQALHYLCLDEIWWLVVPQNPLKSTIETASFDDRIINAKNVVNNHPAIHVTGLEAQLGSSYTSDTINILINRFPTIRFVWLMGADNLAQIHKWKNWISIFQRVAIAVFDRSPYSYSSLTGKASRRFAKYRLSIHQSALLAHRVPPAWIFLHLKRHSASATTIRHILTKTLEEQQHFRDKYIF